MKINLMNGTTHQLVSNLALACLQIEERHVLYPRWGGIESGSTLSDTFRIMWEPESIENRKKQLVHRYYVDSSNSKDHGGLTRAWDHASGIISFIEDYMEAPVESGYTEDEFLENLGMFLGIISHHIADLCTPVHVGHKIDYSKIKTKNKKSFHQQVERDIDRFSRKVPLFLFTPKKVRLSKEYFKCIAVETYNDLFVKLEGIYSAPETDKIKEMVSQVVSNSVRHTANVWHSILTSTEMLNQKWSMQPLL